MCIAGTQNFCTIMRRREWFSFGELIYIKISMNRINTFEQENCVHKKYPSHDHQKKTVVCKLCSHWNNLNNVFPLGFPLNSSVYLFLDADLNRNFIFHGVNLLFEMIKFCTWNASGGAPRGRERQWRKMMRSQSQRATEWKIDDDSIHRTTTQTLSLRYSLALIKVIK